MKDKVVSRNYSTPEPASNEPDASAASAITRDGRGRHRRVVPADPKAFDPNAEIIRPRDLPKAIGLTYVTVWRMIQRGDDFPAPLQLSARAIGWTRADLQAWRESRRRQVPA